MRLLQRALRIAAALTAAALGASATAHAQDAFPSRPVTLVVPFAPGGNTDIVARLVADRMTPLLGQQVVVENRGGAGGALGSTAVARAAPDGYTILMATVSTHAIGPALTRRPAYDPVTDFAPISLLANVPNIVVTTPSLGVRTPAELIAKLKAEPGKYDFGSPGVGSIGHLQGAWFNTLAGVTAEHVPYKGTGQAVQDLIGGTIHIMHDNVPPMLPLIRAGQAVPIMVTTERRIAALPDVPTSAEAGMPTFLSYSWNMLLAPKGTPQPVIDRLHKAALDALGDPGLRSRMSELNLEIVGSTPAAALEHLRAEAAKWRPIVEASGARTD